MPSAADDDAAQRRDIAEVPAPSDDDVPGTDPYIVGGIEVDPAEGRTKHRNPGVRRIRSEGGRLGTRRRGAQVAADVACRQAERTQAGQHDVREILTDT